MTSTAIPLSYKPKVNKSAKNLSQVKRLSLLPGVNIPTLFSDMYPHDYFKISIDSLLQSNALQAPLMGNFKLRNICVFEPLSNLYGWYDNNTRQTTAEIMSKKMHTYAIPSTPPGNDYQPQLDDPDSTEITGIPRGGIFDYLGIPPGTLNTDPSEESSNLVICVDRILAYIDFIRMYSVNRQEESVPYLIGGLNSSITPVRYVPISTLDSLFMELRYLKDGFAFGEDTVPSGNIGMLWFENYLSECCKGKNSGLFLALYEPDFFMNFLSNKVGTTVSKVSMDSSNSFTIHELYFRNKIQKIIDSFDLSGGVMSNWSRTLWGARPKGSRDVPDIIGSVTHVIDPSNVTIVSNTYNETAGTGSAAGELAGNINQYNNSRNGSNNRFHFGTQEEGIFLVITQLIPLPDYSQGIDTPLTRLTYMDKYKEQLQRLGFQDVAQKIYSALPNTNSTGQNALGGTTGYNVERNLYKQIAWLDLMTATNRVHGDFSNFGSKEYWTLNRRFATYSSMANGNRRLSRFDFSKYIDPRDWQYMFAAQTASDHNFYLQLGFGIKAIRPMGKRFIPSMD